MSDPLAGGAALATVSVARFLDRTCAEGPGLRTAIWVQGCSIRCRGCFNPHMWPFRGGTPISARSLVERVLAAGTEGVTLLGGEPFDQAGPLARVAAGVQATGLSVMTFSGYTFEWLRGAAGEGHADIAALLDATDLLVAGPFLREHLDRKRPWLGSTNQELVPLGSHGTHLLEWMPETPDRLEIRVDAGGTIRVNGWADTDRLDALLNDALSNDALSNDARPGRGRGKPRDQGGSPHREAE